MTMVLVCLTTNYLVEVVSSIDHGIVFVCLCVWSISALSWLASRLL